MKDLKNLAWIDLEMTGLNPDYDVILEIAAVVTDFQLNVVAESKNIIICHSDVIMESMNDEVRALHTKSGLIEACKQSNTVLKQAEQEILEFLKTYCYQAVSPLCGNTIWQDRRFLIKYMPAINNFFHYRNIDVSSIKELVQRWYNVDYKKKNLHRSLDDIRESIEELKYYRDNFFAKNFTP